MLLLPNLECTAHQTAPFPCLNNLGESLCGFQCLRYKCSKSSQILSLERHIHQKKQSSVRNQNRTTCCPYTIAKMQLFEHVLAAVARVLSFLKGSTLAGFSKSSLWWSEKSLNLYLLYWGILLPACRSRNDLFAPPALNLGFLSTNSRFPHFLDC